MKKVYTKPEIIFENFALSSNIAGGCEVRTNTPSQGNCAYIVNAGPVTFNIFLSDMQGICTTTEADGDYNGICYHVPTETNNLFNS